MRLSMLFIVCALAAAPIVFVPTDVDAQGICIMAGCEHCHTHSETEFTPKKHHFAPGFGSCYECDEGDEHECGEEESEPLLGSCGSVHEICQTEPELAAQQLMRAVRTVNLAAIGRSLSTAKEINVGREVATIVLAGCTGAAPLVVELPSAIVAAALPKLPSVPESDRKP
jgi:hypothetical protein